MYLNKTKMSEDFVNQLTLNCLISKTQLQKLTRHLKENTENIKKTNKEIYGDRLKQLFNDLLLDNPPDNMLQDVNISFDYFLDKCVYYFKAIDNNESLEKDRFNCDDIKDDIDYEREERAIANGNYREKEEEEEEEEEETPVIKKTLDDRFNLQSTLIVRKKTNTKTSNSTGVDDIQKLPLDWFQSVKQTNKQNKIIPRQKEHM